MTAVTMLTTILTSVAASMLPTGTYEMPRATLDQWTCDYSRCSDTPPHGKLILKMNDGILTLSGWQDATLARAVPMDEGYVGRTKVDKHWNGDAEQWDLIFIGDGEFMRGILMHVLGTISDDGQSIELQSQCLCNYLFQAMRVPRF